jgi:hypothetical protein
MGFKLNGICSTHESDNEFDNRITTRVSEAKAVLVKAKDQFQLYYDRRCVPALEVKVSN